MATNVAGLESKLRQRCTELGVQLDLENLMEMWSPPGKKFASNGCHVSCAFMDFDWKTNKRAMLNMFLSDIEYGFEDCTEIDCEVCTPGTP